jgi:hypothetical protein
MLRAVVENKYSFNMQVSAEAMAGLRGTSIVRLIVPAIGLRYGPIFNPYLRQAPLYESSAPRSKAPRLHEHERAAVLLLF